MGHYLAFGLNGAREPVVVFADPGDDGRGAWLFEAKQVEGKFKKRKIDGSPSMDAGEYVSMAMNKAGQPIVAYRDAESQLRTADTFAEPGVWKVSKGKKKMPTAESCKEVVIAIDDSDNVLLAYGESDEIWLARSSSGGNWTKNKVASNADYASSLQLVPGAGAVVHLAYRDENGALMYVQTTA